MDVYVLQNPKELGKAAGAAAAQLIRDAIRRNGTANIILATGASQFETLNQLISEKDIEWNKVTMFHLDEYIGLPESHPASFRKYLKERFLAKVPPLKAAYLVNGEADPAGECARLHHILSTHKIDVALVGIGENGHLAFNDPPADFDTEAAYIIVNLDEPCRKQQLGEGWFGSLEEVPLKAISMSVKQILKAEAIICSVPDSRKAIAVKNSVEREVSNLYPASILQTHANCRFYLDHNSAALLSSQKITQ
ncbi:glucosamine-6-phosphate deaminase [Flavihumibacter profundi]|uniref:glucosamine-6-phosphate deaminase n=1 Tax=Flavihumibacter profundi TaxID=2716883 RepID=UPI001CC4FF10|nr:glucosamine-6-phosphate deaminase [Flavihumibacter profundi]MBZ5858262.1 glucosamine-6-phosphate deaminase [Flavihumibacter profundi]